MSKDQGDDKKPGFFRETWFLIFLVMASLLLMGAGRSPAATARLTIINKSGMEIAVQLNGQAHTCANQCDEIQGLSYYLLVSKGDKEKPAWRVIDIEKNTYQMRVFYMETYDPVYGFKCQDPGPNGLIAMHDQRLVVLSCDQAPPNIGEPGLRKYLPFPVGPLPFRDAYWYTRLVY
jgi:hypothetical protein